MPVLAVLMLLLGSMLSLAVLALVLVAATDRLRSMVDRLVAVRGRVEPVLEALQADVTEARAGLARVEARRRLDDGRTNAR